MFNYLLGLGHGGASVPPLEGVLGAGLDLVPCLGEAVDPPLHLFVAGGNNEVGARRSHHLEAELLVLVVLGPHRPHIPHQHHSLLFTFMNKGEGQVVTKKK